MWVRDELPWLPAVKADFRDCVKALDAASTTLASDLRALASQRLSVNQLSTIQRAVRRLKAAGATFKALRSLRLVIISDASTELINEAIVGTGIRHGLDIEVIQLPFGSPQSQILDPSSELNSIRPDVVWILLTNRYFLRERDGNLLIDASAEERATQAAEDLKRMEAMIVGRLGATVILQTVPPPSEALFGSADARIDRTVRAFFRAFNDRVLQLAGGTNLILDLDGLSQSIGLDEWHDPIQWHAYKLPFSQRLVPLVADHLVRLLAAWKGLSRKCLVLDLDNVVWGGVVGDDGIEGIRIGQGSAAGEAHLDVQRLALDLRSRGIVLVVSSKNDDEVARLPFRKHPDMLLKEEHIAVFQANWLDKAANLRKIAETLDLGLDALVLLDDNPAEREQVRGELPEVAVPELPSDPAYYARALTAAGYFEAIGIVDEDLSRASMYGQNAQRVELLESSSDMDSYLKSLDMRISFAPFDHQGRARIAQLINKSNQFNLTTKRYSEADVASLESDNDAVTMQVRLVDRFGDNGMIAVIIARASAPGEFEIDTWLMSCRVLRRRVEEAVLEQLAALVEARGARRLIGKFIPTGRNELVREHYLKLGFEHVATDESGATLWSLRLSEMKRSPLPFNFTASAVA